MNELMTEAEAEETIEALREQAWRSGDDALVRICEVALSLIGSYEDRNGARWTKESAMTECRRVISEARSRAFLN